MSLSKDASKEQVEVTTTATEVEVLEERPKRGKFMTFVRKWWWAILIAQSVALLVSFPPL